MRGVYPYQQLTKYPHMLKSDAAIWHRFVEQHPRFFDSVDYDEHVGEGQTPPAGIEENYARMIVSLTQRRIDVTGYKGKEVWICELKHDPGVSALGQCIAYKQLYKKQYPATGRIISCLICNRLDEDLKYILQKNRVRYYIS